MNHTCWTGIIFFWWSIQRVKAGENHVKGEVYVENLSKPMPEMFLSKKMYIERMWIVEINKSKTDVSKDFLMNRPSESPIPRGE
jgi:hypothetical protein